MGKVSTKKNKGTSETDGEDSVMPPATNSRSVKLASGGISTSDDVKRLMAAIVPDILEGKVNTQTASSVCNAVGKLLKVVELELKYGAGDYPKPHHRAVTGLKLVAGD